MSKRNPGLLVLLLAGIIIGLFFFKNKSGEIGKTDADVYTTYKKHYVMITGKEDGDFWDKVYASALEEGRKRDAYVERFGEDLAVEYSRNELLEMAIRASVDGIIVPGDEDRETVQLLDEAVGLGIPVVTVMEDSPGSLRQCFVGNNNYNLGQEYGGQILSILAERKEEKDSHRVLVLMDDSRTNTSQNLILLGIRETLDRELGENHSVAVETMPVDDTRSFSSEEAIRDIFLDQENLPDFLICLNAVHTRCAYQAAVDYNKVGTVHMLGYYDSDTILNAVAKNIIDATITLDTEQMGRLCVMALDEYVETGYTNGYMAVDTRLITAEEARQMTEAAETE